MKRQPVARRRRHSSDHQLPFLRNFRRDISWRIFRIMAEFIEGFNFLADSKNEVTIFGSGLADRQSPYYRQARILAGKLAAAGYTIITGGGPGIMEAANRGATEAGGESIGLNIQLPREQRVNPYVKKGMGFAYFFTRKVMLSISAQAYIFFPGGYGTLDEFFEIITLMQTGKMPVGPIICVGRAYWKPLDTFLRGMVYGRHRAVRQADLSLYTISDSLDEIVTIIKKTKDRPLA